MFRLPPGRAGRLLALLACVAGSACAHAPAPLPAPPLTPSLAPTQTSGPFRQEGLASFYSDELSGRLTANGERYRPEALTAAHRRLPFGTRVRVTAVASGQSVIVRINDRGPFVPGRIIDLSREAARRIGLLSSGVVRVQLEALPAGSVTPAPVVDVD